MVDEAWNKCFPLPSAERAVMAIHQAWADITSQPRTYFNAKTREPDLTVFLCQYVRDVTATTNKLMGNWATENVEAVIDKKNGKLIKTRRTDIQYFWNSEKENLDLTFEFKKLSDTSQSRNHYTGPKGMRRFVTGTYARNRPIAIMVGMLTVPHAHAVPPLETKLCKTNVVKTLAMRICSNGEYVCKPSDVFDPISEFNTEHDRPTAVSPDHSVIGIAHIFLPLV